MHMYCTFAGDLLPYLWLVTIRGLVYLHHNTGATREQWGIAVYQPLAGDVRHAGIDMAVITVTGILFCSICYEIFQTPPVDNQ